MPSCLVPLTAYSMIVKADTNPLSGHRKRLRQRLEYEPQAVADYEVLELLLGLGLPRRDTKILAHKLLDRFQTIRGVLDAKPAELEQMDGFGPSLVSLWRLFRELMARYALAPLMTKEVMASPEAVANAARHRLGNLPHEECWLALVDVQNNMISWERLRRGSISSIGLEPRDVFEVALLRKASGIILVHNHPGGSTRPSSADLQLTTELQNLAPRLGLRFLDHLIVTAGDCYSIAASRVIRIKEVK